MTQSDNSVFVTGHAKPVKEDAINAVYHILSLSLIIDPNTDCIEDVACTMVMRASEDFIRALFKGKSIVADMELMCELLRTRFLSLAQKPLIVALKDVQNRYLHAFPNKRAQ